MTRMTLRTAWVALPILTTLVMISGCGEQTPAVTVTIKGDAVGETTEGAAAGPTAAAAGFGDLVGTIKFEGTAPNLTALIAKGDAGARDSAVCAAEAIPDESLVVNSANQGIANVFVFLEKAPAGAASPEPAEPAIFDQKGCRFFPHTLFVRTKQKVMILSDDSVAHNTHTFPQRNTPFNQAIKANERSGVAMTYDRPEKEPVEVKCDFHPWMKAFHLPLDHGFAAVTDADGKFTIKGLPAGKHSLQVWHERGRKLEKRGLEVTIEADKETTVEKSYGAPVFARQLPHTGRTIVLGRAGR